MPRQSLLAHPDDSVAGQECKTRSIAGTCALGERHPYAVEGLVSRPGMEPSLLCNYFNGLGNDCILCEERRCTAPVAKARTSGRCHQKDVIKAVLNLNALKDAFKMNLKVE